MILFHLIQAKKLKNAQSTFLIDLLVRLYFNHNPQRKELFTDYEY